MQIKQDLWIFTYNIIVKFTIILYVSGHDQEGPFSCYILYKIVSFVHVYFVIYN